MAFFVVLRSSHSRTRRRQRAAWLQYTQRLLRRCLSAWRVYARRSRQEARDEVRRRAVAEAQRLAQERVEARREAERERSAAVKNVCLSVCLFVLLCMCVAILQPGCLCVC